jgi:hypothetical protein
MERGAPVSSGRTGHGSTALAALCRRHQVGRCGSSTSAPTAMIRLKILVC